MFSVHTTPEEFENAIITGHFGFVVEETPVQGNHMIIVTPSFSKRFVFGNDFRLRKNAKPVFSNSSDLKTVFEKLRLRNELVWTEGLQWK